MHRPASFRVGAYRSTAAEPIGRGSFAEVFRGETTATGAPCAIKAINLAQLKRQNQRLLDHLNAEVRVMKRLAHRNVVRLFDVVLREPYLYLVLELAAYGDLSALLRARGDAASERRLPEHRARFFMLQLRDGLQFLRDERIMHRDLKPQNLLLAAPPPSLAASDAFVLKIADFGFARELAASMAETVCGSPLYMAPEVLRGDQYTEKADLYSVGAILYELLCGTVPFRANSPMALQRLHDQQSAALPRDVQVSRACAELVLALLRIDVRQRIDFEAYFAHAWFALGVDDNDYRTVVALGLQPADAPAHEPSAARHESAPQPMRRGRARAGTAPGSSPPMYDPAAAQRNMGRSTLDVPRRLTAVDAAERDFLTQAVHIDSEEQLLRDVERRRRAVKAVVDEAGQLADAQPEEALALYVAALGALRHTLARAHDSLRRESSDSAGAGAAVALAGSPPAALEGSGAHLEPIRVSLALGSLKQLAHDVAVAAASVRGDLNDSLRRDSGSSGGERSTLRASLLAPGIPFVRGDTALLIMERALRHGRNAATAEQAGTLGRATRLYTTGRHLVDFLVDAAVEASDRATLTDILAKFDQRLAQTQQELQQD